MGREGGIGLDGGADSEGVFAGAEEAEEAEEASEEFSVGIIEGGGI